MTCSRWKSSVPNPSRPSKAKARLDRRTRKEPLQEQQQTVYILKLAKDVSLATASALRRSGRLWFSRWRRHAHGRFVARGTSKESLELGRIFTPGIHERYGIIAGPDEARAAYRQLPVDVEELEANLSALEARMTGPRTLTQRLSDDCAFVFKPLQVPP